MAQRLLALLLSLLLSACSLSLEFQGDNTNSGPSPDTSASPFVDVTEQAGIVAAHRGLWLSYATAPYQNGYLAAGSAWGDYNNDGYQDLFIAGNLAPNVLFVNNRDSTFSAAPDTDNLKLPEIPTGGAVWGDYDNDGYRDLYVLNLGANRLFRNLAGKTFEDVTDESGVGNTGKGSSAAWGDYDRDGFLDLFVTNWTCHPECSPLDHAFSQDVLYHNLGNGTFEDVSAYLDLPGLLGAGFAASFVDYDNDGDPDIYVVNDKVTNAIGNVLWRNDGHGCAGWCWTNVAASSGTDRVVHGMGLAIGDYDNDQDLDFYFSNMVSPMVLLDNQGDGWFQDATSTAGVGYASGRTVGWGTGFLDYDNDGRLDLYVATTAISDIYGKTGMMFSFPDKLYRNLGDGIFEPPAPAGEEVETASIGFSIADFDNNGSMDMLTGQWNSDFRLHAGQSAGLGHNWVTFDLSIAVQSQAGVNRDAVGARLYLYSDDGRTQMREIRSGSSIGSNNDIRAHFGLGAADIEQLVVVWPNGVKQRYDDISPNRIVLLR